MRTGGITAAAPHGAPSMAASGVCLRAHTVFLFRSGSCKNGRAAGDAKYKSGENRQSEAFLPKSERAVAHFGVAEARAAEAPAAPHAVRQTDKREVKI